MGEDALKGPLNYWKTLAGGDRNAITQLLGPELDSISERSAASRTAVSQFAPRGTAMANRLGDISEGENRDINQSILGARPEANSQLSQLAQLIFGVGTNMQNAATGSSGQALNALLGYRSGNLQSQQLRQQGLGNLFGLIPSVSFTHNI